MPIVAIAAGVSAATGLVGYLSNKSAQERAAILQQKGVQEWLDLNIPDPAQQRLALEKFVSQGELIPELEQPLRAADSEFKQIAADPKMRAVRERALASLEEQGYGGESLQDSAAREKAIIESGAANRGRQQAIVGDLGRRGQLGGGLELAARLDASQAEGDRLSTQAMDLESNRRLRALNAIAGAGELAGQISDDDYRLKSDAARASDAINLFNTQNAQGVLTRNVNRGNEAQQYNLANKQRIADQNVGLSNFEQQYNKELEQKRFENEAMRKAGITGQYAQRAANELAGGQNAAQMWGNIASGVGSVALGAAKYGARDSLDPKTNKTPVVGTKPVSSARYDNPWDKDEEEMV